MLEDHAVKGQLDNKYDVVNGSERVQNNVDTEHLQSPNKNYPKKKGDLQLMSLFCQI